MKIKNLLLLFFSVLCFSATTKAQIVTCNANFTEVINGLSVSFTPAVVGDSLSTTHHWSFGDGFTSNTPVTQHTYSFGGVYMVKHVIKKKNPNGTLLCADSVTRAITLQTPCNIQAYFTHSVDTINPFIIYFTNQSPGFNAATDSIRWSFGDGTPFVYTQNPSHTYTAPGTYNVCIRISRPASGTNAPCVREYCKQIVVMNCLVNANFSHSVSGLTTSFLNTSTTTGSFTNYLWTFGDGATSTVANPIHTYTTSGSYFVTLQVVAIQNGITCIDTISKFVSVMNSCNLQANFTHTRDSINRKKFYFTNTTLNFAATDTIRWSFGDGTPFVYTQNPTHTFANYGTYNVCIRVSRPSIAAGGAPCVSELCDTIVVDSVAPISCNAAFTKTIQGLTVAFVSTMPGGNNTIHQWHFGNGNTSTLVNPVHTYSTGGVYTVIHYVKVMGGNGTILCMDSSIQTITLTNPTPCNLQANFSFVRDSINRKKFYFTNTTFNFQATDTIRWNFGDGTPFVYTQNPTHTFANYGTYNVCIRVSRAVPAGSPPCVTDICKVVVVDSLPQVSCTAAFTKTIQGLTVAFISAMPSAPNVVHQWSFGNGTNSSLANPIITYATGGVYQVKHKVLVFAANSNFPICADSVTQTITLVSNPCNLQANFSSVRDSINKKKYYFSNTTLNFLPTDSIRWNFGDGSPFVYTQNPTHTFANYGLYNVCIRVWRQTVSGTPCVSEICKMLAVDSNGVIVIPCPYVVDFTMRRDSFNVRKIHFTNTSQQIPGAIATWYFGDGNISNSWNAVHTYAGNAAAYQPCLKVTYSNTCSKTKCKVIQMPTPTPICILQPYPNPTSTVVNAQVNLTQPTVIYTRIYNMQNVIVLQQQQNGLIGINTVTANVASLPIGMYKIRIQYGNKVCSGTFMKN